MSTFDAADEKTFQVRFKTKEAEYAVTEKPFAVPERLTRLGLSQVINHLLDRGTSMFNYLIRFKDTRASILVKLFQIIHISSRN
jgi:hypothetical protein